MAQMSRRSNRTGCPTSEQLQAELERVRHLRRYRRMVHSALSGLLMLALLTVVIVLLFPAYRISSDAMAPTLRKGDVVLTLRGSEVHTGDIIALQYGNKTLIKRVIALSGDVVDIAADGTVFVNGAPLDEPYAVQTARGQCDIELPHTVPPGSCFVLGDNRAQSLDSRSMLIGGIAEEQIIGRLTLRVWPPDQIGLFPTGTPEIREGSQ